MISERSAIQGTGVSIGVAMLCAVGSIYLFTGDVRMSALTLLNVSAIVLVEVRPMPYPNPNPNPSPNPNPNPKP